MFYMGFNLFPPTKQNQGILLWDSIKLITVYFQENRLYFFVACKINNTFNNLIKKIIAEIAYYGVQCEDWIVLEILLSCKICDFIIFFSLHIS